MKELRDQLWDLVYGLLDEADAARLREQITSDRHVAREYARVKLQRELVGQAARANPVERELPTLGERPLPAGLNRAWSPARRIAFTGSLALSVCLLLFAGNVYWSDQSSLRGPNVAQRLEDFERVTPRLLVVGPDELQHDADSTFDVTLETLEGEALVAPIVASLADSDGNTLWRESAPANADGKRQVHVPADKLRGEEALLLTIKVDEKSAADGADNSNATELKTWLSVNEQPKDNLVVMNQVSDGEQYYFRHVQLRSGRSAELSKAVDEVAESFSEKKSGGSRREADFGLADDGGRVRWGRSEQELFLNKYFLAPPTDDAKRQKDSNEDSTKRARESKFNLPGAQVPRKSAAPQAEPQTDPQAVPPAPAPVLDAPAPLEPAPEQPALPGTSTAGSDLGKEQLPAAAPGTSNTPVVTALPKLEQIKQLPEEEQLTQRSKSLEKGKQLVESITAGDTVVASRLVDGTATEETLQARIDQARDAGLIPRGFNGRVSVMWYDAAVAPPQKLAESSFEVGPSVERLTCAITFDRSEYRAGDIAQAEIRVSGADGQGTPAVLNVQVDEVPLTESDALEQPAPAFYLYANAETPRLPLVFDNAAEQTQKVNQSLAGWVTERQESRRHSGLWLLGGSGVGFCMLLAAGCLKGLPKARFWLPVAVLLACSATLGASWLQEQPAAPVQIAAADPLTTHGVQLMPPSRESTTAPSNEQLWEGKAMEKTLSRNDFADMPLAVDDRLLLTAEADEARPTTEQTLLAMEDWDQLAKQSSGSIATKNGDAPGADAVSRFRAGGKENLFGAFTELASKELSDSPSGRPEGSSAGGSSPANAAPRGGDPSGSRTLYWHPRLTAGDDGVCRVQFPIPASPLALRLVVLSHSGQKVGSATRLIPTVVENPRD